MPAYACKNKLEGVVVGGGGGAAPPAAFVVWPCLAKTMGSGAGAWRREGGSMGEYVVRG